MATALAAWTPLAEDPDARDLDAHDAECVDAHDAECVVCLDAPRSVKGACGHVLMCGECAAAWTARGGTCPYCRA